MANEVIGRNESYILVQTNAEGRERALYQDSWNGAFTQTETYNAKRFDDFETADKIAQTLNMLYQLTGQQMHVKTAHEIIDRQLVGEEETE